jgi:vacuolar protein sorting-associated protein 3
MDLDRGRTIPLFPIMSNADISEDAPTAEPTLPPLIASIGEDDFLVVTGTSLQDPSIGMFVDLTGEPVRGTLMFSTYPRTLSILILNGF